MSTAHRPSYDDLLPQVTAIYDRHAAGCCLHIVLDDGNVKDDDVEWCIERAEELGHADCLALARALRLASQRTRLRLNYWS